jgi:hypothetical protein
LELNTSSVQSNDAGHGLSHGSSVADSLFELSANVFCNDLCVQFWLSNFADIDLNYQGGVSFSNSLVERIRQLIDSFSASSDNSARPCCEDVDLQSVGCSFNFDSANVSKTNSLLDVSADVMVEFDRFCISFLFVEPMAVMTANNADAQAHWVNFLTH